ncbi:MAG: BamA/TamA family outer membrane protein [Ignavibacteriaceae bacterium]
MIVLKDKLSDRRVFIPALIYVILMLLLANKTSAEPSDSLRFSLQYPVVIDTIKITGNDITEEEIILRELTFGVGDTLTTEEAQYSQERIYSLGLFSKVEINPMLSESETTILNINVEESWYIYPVPFADLKDNDWDKLTYGFFLMIRNFRGLNETIASKVGFGYDPSFSVSYHKPSITRGSDVFFKIETSYHHINNISSTAENLYGQPFEHTMSLNHLLIGKRFGLFHWLGVNINYNYIETPFFIKGISASNSRIDRFPSAGLNYTYDTRDLMQFSKDGIFFSSSIQWKGFGINDISYGVSNIDFREYRKLFGDLHGKWRFAARAAFGEDVPFYDYSYLGLSERIRGHYDKQREGHEYYISSLELYQPVIKDLNISFDWVPLLPKNLLRYRVALYLQLFVDTGAVQLSNRRLSIHNFDTGFGGGLTLLILPYNSMRVEFASDEYGNTEFILDLGMSF